MNAIFIIVIVIAILSPVVGLLFWYFVFKAVVNHVEAYENEQIELMRLVNKYSKQNYQGQIPPEVYNQVKSKFMSMQNHVNQMNYLQRQQYETKITGMTSSVIGAGFTDFDPSSYC